MNILDGLRGSFDANVQNLRFASASRHLKGQKKIVYGLTPPSRLKNIGDHAQAIAIHQWLRKHFPGTPVLEMDKDQGKALLPALKWLTGPDDVIILHSGGNLSDRALWSEGARRLYIESFPQNQIVSLPQTIFFSDSEKGREERERTRAIYATHPRLTVIGRDPQSGELAAELFPGARTLCMPDFVLSLPPRPSSASNEALKALLCLRLDEESALTPEERKQIGESLPYESTYYDTTLATEIRTDRREAILEETLELFGASDLIVTDRYHGLIFSVLCRKPTVVLRTVDHKLTSALSWFQDVPFVRFARDIAEVPRVAQEVMSVSDRSVLDWNAKYFDRIPELAGINRAAVARA